MWGVKLLVFITVCVVFSECNFEEGFLKECQKELSSKYSFGDGEAAQDLERLKEHKPPQSEAGKCFMACLFKKKGMIVDGKFICQADKMPDFPHKEEFVKIMQKCQNEVTDYKDDCDLAGKIGECMHKNMPAMS